MSTAVKWNCCWRIGLCVFTVALGACETTGNPREGGLFGWSQKKADARQEELARENSDAQGEAASEQSRQVTLQARQGELAREENRLQNEVNQLLLENSKIENDLRDVVRRTKLDSDELARLHQVLDQNERLRQQLREAHGGLVGEARPQAVHAQNQKLHREIMALLNR